MKGVVPTKMHNLGRHVGVNATNGTGPIPGTTIEFTQINLHHSKSASAVLARCMSKVHTGICLIQEPWIYKGKITGLNGIGTLISGNTEPARTCLIIKGLQAESVPRHCSRDLSTARIFYKGENGEKKALTVAAAYFPYDAESCTPEEVVALIRECEAGGSELIMGCDANAHHTVWGSSNCNQRGEKLLEFLASSRMDILNVGSRPTFQNAVREDVIDITLASRKIWSEVTNWGVSSEVSMSDHNHIVFRLGGCSEANALVRNPRKTNWVGYKEELKAKIGNFPVTYGTAEDIAARSFRI